MTIPPGQKARADFPRFGLPQYAHRFPNKLRDLSIAIRINEEPQFRIDALADLAGTTQQSDFHCVTTWTYQDAVWGGVKFADFYHKHVANGSRPNLQVAGAVFYAQDGYRTSLLLEDLLQDSVMLADSLNGQPLPIEHGAPLRLIAPEHYGYKNLKHVKRIDFFTTMPVIKRGPLAFLDHPRARVHKEERGRWFPGWILRYVFRLLITSTAKKFHSAMLAYRSNST